jgi:DNA-directed RNA polymerase subunit RPC12/RpoP/very-short-patch-repair endonuclease
MGSMAILEKEVLVTINSRTVKYYENKGYFIPRRKDRNGRLTTPVGTKILVDIKDLPKTSTVKVTKICDDCGKKIEKQYYGNIISHRVNGDGRDRCLNCAKTKVELLKKNNVKYENSLEYWAKENNRMILMLEFSDKNKKNPSQISFGTSDKYLWNCSKCHNEYDMKVNKRTTGKQNCPYCSGKKVLKGFNDLWTTYPEIADLLEDKQKGYELTAGSGKKENFKCKDCGYIIKNKSINEAVRRGIHCPRCGDGISYPEKFLLNVLNQCNVSFENQKLFNWSENKRFDFYIEKLNMIIEIHGEQHYAYTGFTRSLKEEQENDKIKKELAINNIKNFIVIDARNSDLNYIKDNIIKSKLKNFVDLSNVDWIKCNEYACNSLVKLANEMWMNGIRSTSEIGERLKIHPANIIKYLKRGAKLGWSDYIAILGGTNKKKIIQLSLEGKFIKEWDSIRGAGKELNLDFSTIANACKGIIKSAYGYMWVYKEDYDETKITPYKRKTRGINIVKLDFDDNFLEEFPNITKAVSALNNGKVSHSKINVISLACKGEIENAYGFKWMFKEDYNELITQN